MQTEKLRWGIIGAGNIAGAFGAGLKSSKTGLLTAVGSRSLQKAQHFASQYSPDAICFGDYQELFESDACDAVYIATPHPMHAQSAIAAAACQKHILCEKPIGLNMADTQAIIAAAKRGNIFLMEAFMYRCHPLINRLREQLAAGVIGEPRFIQAAFSFQSKRDLESRLYSPKLGGDGILDVGGYPVSFARLVAGARQGRWFEDPVAVTGGGQVPEDSGVDEWAAATLQFSGGLVAEVFCGIQLKTPPSATIHGTEGRIEFPAPWMASRDGGAATFTIIKPDGSREEISESLVDGEAALYGCEADVVARDLANKEAAPMSWDDTLGNMETLEKWRKGLGVIYPSEKPGTLAGPLHGGPLRRPSEPAIKRGTIAGIEKPVSRLVLGSIGFHGLPHMAMMFDEFFERGGNTFDTSWHYGQGRIDAMLGAWIQSRGVREEVVIFAKGAHTPWCTPHFFREQLEESLEKLQTDYADIYMLHRDNPEVAVEEWVDAMEEARQAGKFKVYGGSNWSRERMIAANEYAKKIGVPGFTVWSNQFSLARMEQPVWGGCLSASEPDDRAWLEANQIHLMPWSSQARGFFTDRSGPDKRGDKLLANSFYSEANFERKRRCYALAGHLGVPPITVAAAYVLSQPFPTFPLIGPRAPWEMDESIEALHIALDAPQRDWLNLQSDQQPF